MTCIAVLFAAYGVGLGVRKIRGVDAQAPTVAAADTDKPTDEPESDAPKSGRKNPTRNLMKKSPPDRNVLEEAPRWLWLGRRDPGE
ncbi:MAG: hypothetical protein ACYSWQ_10260 [Planctomycetota bacterium]